MKSDRRRVTIDVRDPVQRELYEQFLRARQAWGDKGQKLDMPIIQALQERARVVENLRKQQQAAAEEEGRHRRGDEMRQRLRDQDARRALIPQPDPHHYQTFAEYNRAIEEWRVMARAAARQYPEGVYGVAQPNEAEFAQRRINMRDAVNMERQRQNEMARQRYNMGIMDEAELNRRQRLVEQGDLAMRDLFQAPGGAPNPEERVRQRARDWADHHNAGIRRMLYHPEEPKRPEEPAHLQEFDEV